MSTRSKTAPIVPARLGGVAVEYDDSSNPGNYGLVRIVCEAQVRLSGTGLAAVIAQASSYLAAAKVTALQAAGASVTFDATVAAASYSCLAADAAAQVANLTSIAGTGANFTQTAGFPV